MTALSFVARQRLTVESKSVRSMIAQRRDTGIRTSIARIRAPKEGVLDRECHLDDRAVECLVARRR